MMYKTIILMSVFAVACANTNSIKNAKNSQVKLSGSMKNVMWKGELQGTIKLDTIQNQDGLYGIGPLNELRGEILVVNGESYVSKVIDSNNMNVEKNNKISAPFFVYSNVHNWNKAVLPETVTSIKSLDDYLNTNYSKKGKPYFFKLTGRVESANFHIQNLAEGSEVSSPKEAHAGQINYKIENEEVTLVGVFSTDHHGIFTHHDSNVHIHILTSDEQKMGHLDSVLFKSENMTFSIPVEVEKIANK